MADVVGLNLQLASLVLLFGIIWDAANDLLVGTISDRVQTRRGRRRPFLPWFAVPFSLSFLLMWVAPGWQSQAALLVHVLFAFMLLFFILYWLESGDQSPMLEVPLVGSLAVESAILGLILGPAALALPLWLFLARRINKHVAYIVGIAIWMVAQVMFLLIQPGQRDFAPVLAFVAGMGISAAHVLPDAIFPDIMEWDELLTGRKRVGAFYGIRTFVRKLATAVALAVASQILGMSGYQSPPVGAARFQQIPDTLLTIRLLTGAGVTAVLMLAITTAVFYPLNREKHARVRTLLARRRKQQASRQDLVE